MSDQSAEIVQGFWIAFFGTCSYVSIAALAVYDYCITFDQEVQHIWKRRFNLASVIFIVNRYATLFKILGFVAFELFARTPSSCRGLWFSSLVSAFLLQSALLSFFVLRTWAIWGQNYLPLLVLTPLALGILALGPASNFASAYAGFFPLQSSYGGCIVVSTIPSHVASKLSNGFSAFSMTFSFLALCGTLAKTFEVKRAATQAGIKATLTTLLIRDGTAYLLFNFIGNILTIAHKSLNNTVPGFEVTVGFTTGFVPIIISRLILNLRNIDDQVIQASLPELSQNSSHISSLRIIGNVGAPVSMSLIDTDEDEEDYIPATTTQVSARQIVENPLTVGLFDQRPDSTINRENVGEAWEMGTDLVTKEK